MSTTLKLDPEDAIREAFDKEWNVIVYNDDKHSYEDVMKAMVQVCQVDIREAYEMTCKVDKEGKCIVLTTHLERAEFCKDVLINDHKLISSIEQN